MTQQLYRVYIHTMPYNEYEDWTQFHTQSLDAANKYCVFMNDLWKKFSKESSVVLNADDIDEDEELEKLWKKYFEKHKVTPDFWWHSEIKWKVEEEFLNIRTEEEILKELE